jgi:hypothetical protein
VRANVEGRTLRASVVAGTRLEMIRGWTGFNSNRSSDIKSRMTIERESQGFPEGHVGIPTLRIDNGFPRVCTGSRPLLRQSFR